MDFFIFSYALPPIEKYIFSPLALVSVSTGFDVSASEVIRKE
jgi:hypothetical protein